MALWLFGAFLQSFAGHVGVSTPAAMSRLVWFGHFQMFTDLRPTHAVIRATHARASAPPEAVDLEALYPMGWRAGPGYTRGGFLRDPSRLAQLGRVTCARLRASAGAPAGRLTLSRVVWARRPGQADQAPPPEATGAGDGRAEVLLEMDCGAPSE
jgi:hypothetical protein